jgi:hypothetical protein
MHELGHHIGIHSRIAIGGLIGRSQHLDGLQQARHGLGLYVKTVAGLYFLDVCVDRYLCRAEFEGIAQRIAQRVKVDAGLGERGTRLCFGIGERLAGGYPIANRRLHMRFRGGEIID